MIYASQLRDKQVWDAWGHPVGQCVDILLTHLEEPFPPILALAVRDTTGTLQFIDAEFVSGLFPSIILKAPLAALVPYKPHGEELWLLDRILDRQIVDTDGRRVVRVNDIQIARIQDHFCVTGVDAGGIGLLRRLGLEKPFKAAARLLRRPANVSVIPWEDVAPLQQEDPIRLRISREKISQLPAADIAAIINDLDRKTGQALISALDDETLADALEESPNETQIAILSQLAPERAADILEQMGPDEAADLLAELPDQTSTQLLDLMEDEDAEDVRQLLGYPEDSAGGIMTTEFAQVPEGLQAEAALNYLRHSPEAQDDEALYYIYLVDGEERLRGVTRLRDLVMALPETPVEAFAEREPLSVDPHTPQTDVAYLIAKYDLLAMPVVEPESGKLLGIVTVDDAIDAVLPTAWKKRLPRFF